MIRQAHHYGVTVSDLETALGFYRDKLGLSETDRLDADSEAFSRFVDVPDADVEAVFLEAEGCLVEILEYTSPPGDNLNADAANNDVGAAHICFEVEDLDALYADLEPEIDFVSEPQSIDNGAYVVYAHDPDGNVVEFLDA